MSIEATTEENMRVDYIDFKTELLGHFGLTNADAVRKYLTNACCNAKTELKRRIQIDNAGRQLLKNYYDGDRTYAHKRAIN